MNEKKILEEYKMIPVRESTHDQIKNIKCFSKETFDAVVIRLIQLNYKNSYNQKVGWNGAIDEIAKNIVSMKVNTMKDLWNLLDLMKR